MNNNEIKKKYNIKVKELKLHNKLYFDKNNPKISDSDYDELKKEIFDLENQYSFLDNKDSPSKNVGFKPSKNFLKSKHRVKMLSLSNVFTKEDLDNFEKKIINYLDFNKNFKIEYSVEPKIDGISASLTYKNGVLITGVSRGDGQQGELITENLKTIKDIPHTISSKDFPQDIDIRGEVFILNSDFEKINKNFANPRNAASGSLRQKNPNETKKIPLKFVAYSFGFFKKNTFLKQSDFIESLKNWGFKTSKYNKIISGTENLIKNHLDFENKLKLNYPNKPPIPSLSDHKFTRGSCIIIAGENLVGAAKLAFFGATQSALRVGSGLCKLMVKKSQVNIFKPHILEEMLVPYSNIKDLQEIIKSERNQVIIFGCGVDNNYKNQKILKFLLKQPLKLVLDAVVFSMMSNNRDNYLSLLKSRNNSTIMTPHAGEFNRLFKSTNNKIYDTINAAQESNSIIVHKGNDTLIVSPKKECFINSQSSPYLATAGSGDVLSGLIGGFLAQKLEPLHSAQLGCYVHSQCGINLNVGLTAGDLIKEIPKVLKSFY